MARTKFDPNAAFKNIVGVAADEAGEISATEQITEENNTTLKREVSKAEPKQTEIRPTKEILVQKAYYITVKQYRALKLQAAIGDEKDMSAIVRAALDAYLVEALKKVN